MESVKNKKAHALRNFTRSETGFNCVLDKKLPLDVLTTAFDKVQSFFFAKLEAA